MATKPISKRTKAKGLGPFRPSTLVSGLSGDDWQKLIAELLEAELHVAGLTAADLERPLAANRPDGGADAFLKKAPPRPTAFLATGPCAFQFKRALPSIASLASEIARSDFLLPKLTSGLPYTLVVGSDLGAEREKIASALVAALKRHRIKATGSVTVVGADWVLRFLRDHPFAWRHVPGAPPAALHLKTLEQWGTAQQRVGTNFPWTEDPDRTEVLKALLAQLGTPGKALRLQGPPGVGKSRLALELARRFSATNSDVVVLEADEAGAEDLSGFTGIPMRGLLIIDECSIERHRAIQRNWQSTRGSVLTIGSEDLRDIERDDAASPWIGPLQLEQLRALARNTPSTLDEPTRVYLAEKSGGYLKLFRLLLDAVKAAQPPLLSTISISQRELLELLEKFITKQNNNDDERARAVRALALPTYVASIKDELPVLAAAVGLTRNQLHDAQLQLGRLALLGSLPGGLYVTPRLLGDWLAERCWTGRECEFLGELKAAGAKPSLIWRCVQRLAGGSRQGLSSLKVLLTDCGQALKASLGSTAIGELIARLSATQQADALELADTLISTSRADLSQEASQSLARALGRCAWEAELFDRAAVLLSRLPDAGRNSFTSLFGAVLGLTRANGVQRLATLRQLSSSADRTVRLLLVDALAEALGEQNHRFISFPGLRVQDSWRPTTHLEGLEYRAAAASLIEPLLSDDDFEVRRAALEAVRHSIRPVARDGFMAIGLQLIQATAHAGAPLDGVRAEARLIEEYDLPRLDEAARKLWAVAQKILAPRTAQERAIAFARTHGVGGQADSQALEIAADLLHETELSGLFDVLGEDFAPLSFDLGQALGSLDTERRLLGLVRKGAAQWKSLRFAAGYILGLAGASELLDELCAHPALAKLTFEATWLAEPSARGAERILNMLRKRMIPASSFQQLLLGGWLLRVDGETASRVIRALGEESIVAFQLAFQRTMGRDGDEALLPLLFESWERLGLDEIRQVAWEWLEVEPLVPPELVAARSIEALRASLTGDHLVPDEVLTALSSAAARAPEETWLRLAAAAEAMEPHQRPTLAVRLRGHLPESADLIASILTWVGNDPERAAFAAAIATPAADSDLNLACRVLDRFPSDPVVRAHLHDSFMSGMFHQESGFWQDRLESLRSFARSKRAALANWAREMIPEIEHSLSRASEVEQAYAEGVLDMPMLGDRLPE